MTFFLSCISMKPLCLFIFLFLICDISYSQSAADDLLNELDSVIENRNSYVNQKLHLIDDYKAKLKNVKGDNQFDIIERIYDEYKSFIYDSAFSYALKLQNIAYHLNDPIKINHSKIKLGFAMV